MGLDMVTIFVGNEAKPYRLHKKLLTSQSDYFKTAFKNEDLVEGQTQEMKMPENDPVVFEILVNWLYKKRLPSSKDFVNKQDGFEACISLFVLADRYLLPKDVRIDIMNLTARLYSSMLQERYDFPIIRPSVLRRAHRDMSEHCPMRLMLLDYAWDSYGLFLRESCFTSSFKMSPEAWLAEATAGYSTEELIKMLVQRDKSNFSESAPSNQRYARGITSVAELKRYQFGFLADHQLEQPSEDDF